MPFETSGESPKPAVGDSQKHDPSNSRLEAWSGKSSAQPNNKPLNTNAIGTYRNSDANIVSNANDFQALQDKYPHCTEPFLDPEGREYGSQKATPPLDIDFTHRTVNGTSEQELTQQGAACPSEDWVKQTAAQLLSDAGDPDLLKRDFHQIEDMTGGIIAAFNKGLPVWNDGEDARWTALEKAIQAAGGELAVGGLSADMRSINGRFSLEAPLVYTRIIRLTPPGGPPVYVRENAKDYPGAGQS